MARYLDRFNQIAGAASTVADLARATQIHTFPVPPNAHVYVHSAHSEVRIVRQDALEVLVSATLQPPFAWSIGAEQDDLGVYFVALRKPVVGIVAVGKFTITIPHDAQVILKLEAVRLTLENFTDTFDLSPVKQVFGQTSGTRRAASTKP